LSALALNLLKERTQFWQYIFCEYLFSTSSQ